MYDSILTCIQFMSFYYACKYSCWIFNLITNFIVMCGSNMEGSLLCGSTSTNLQWNEKNMKTWTYSLHIFINITCRPFNNVLLIYIFFCISFHLWLSFVVVVIVVSLPFGFLLFVFIRPMASPMLVWCSSRKCMPQTHQHINWFKHTYIKSLGNLYSSK